jgi:hypothetical protein
MVIQFLSGVNRPGSQPRDDRGFDDGIDRTGFETGQFETYHHRAEWLWLWHRSLFGAGLSKLEEERREVRHRNVSGLVKMGI